jgi:hypothetical protein
MAVDGPVADDALVGVDAVHQLIPREDLARFGDGRLPNAKELQCLVDYSRSPDTSGSPAIHPVFQASSIKNEAGQKDYPFLWISTPHLDGPVTRRELLMYHSAGPSARCRGRSWMCMVQGHSGGIPRQGVYLGMFTPFSSASLKKWPLYQWTAL